MKLSYFLFLILIFSLSCKKIEQDWYPTVVEGYATNYFTGKPIEGVKITTWFGRWEGAFHVDGEVGSTLTNQYGYYSLKFYADERNNYVLRGSKNSECYKEFIDPMGFLGHGEKNIRNVNSRAIAFIHLRMLNKSPALQAEIYVYLEDLSLYSNHYYPDYTEEGSIVIHDEYFNINWKVIRNNIITNFSDSILVKPCGDYHYTINY